METIIQPVTETEQYQELLSIIEDSGAMHNAFFDRCNANALSHDELKRYIINWFTITKTFAINLLTYCAHLSKLLENGNSDMPREKLESLLQSALLIASGEFESGSHNPDEIHYKAFARLAPKLGIDPLLLDRGDYSHLQATSNLATTIVSAFASKDPLQGFALLFLVETIAYNIVEGMENSLGKQSSSQGIDLFTSQETWYITKHLILEVEHSDEVSTALNLLQLDDDQSLRLKAFLSHLASTFELFWRALYER